MTMPNTEAAEPSSQYATDFELVWGKVDVGTVDGWAALEGVLLKVLPKAARGDDGDWAVAAEDCARDPVLTVPAPPPPPPLPPAGPALRKAWRKGVCRLALGWIVQVCGGDRACC